MSALVAVCGVRGRADLGREGIRHVPVEDVWLIWSYEHDSWWGPDFSGYYRSILSAGVYTREAAENECGRRYAGQRPDEDARRLVDVLQKNTRSDERRPSLADVMRATLVGEAVA